MKHSSQTKDVMTVLTQFLFALAYCSHCSFETNKRTEVILKSFIFCPGSSKPDHHLRMGYTYLVKSFTCKLTLSSHYTNKPFISQSGKCSGIQTIWEHFLGSSSTSGNSRTMLQHRDKRNF